jgi:hypothetical protein
MKLVSRINRVYREMAAKKRKKKTSARKTPKTPPSTPRSRKSPTLNRLRAARNTLPKNLKTLRNRATNLTPTVRLIGAKPAFRRVTNRIKNWESRKFR